MSRLCPHLCVGLSSLPDDDTLFRLFEDSEAKIREGTLPQQALVGTTQHELFCTIRSEISKHITSGQAIAYLKDGYLCWIGWGSIRPFRNVKATAYNQKGFLAGQDSGGSRAYLYSADFWDALKEFHDLNYGVKYKAVGSYLIKDSSAALFEKEVGTPNLYNKDTYLMRRVAEYKEKNPLEGIQNVPEDIYLGQAEWFEYRVADMRLA